MKSTCARGVWLAVVLGSLAGTASGEVAGMPSLLPLPPLMANYPVVQAAATDVLWSQGEAPPAPFVEPGERSIITPDYIDAMTGGYDGRYAACCGHNWYTYANALVMTHEKRGGFVTSIDSTTFEPEVLFCAPEFGNLWHGGAEVGVGWCFGCGCRHALEVVYWGLYPADGTARATGSLNSMIDFSDIDYNGGSGNIPFTNSTVQQVRYGFNFNSVEVNLIGNCCGGGPFGCGMCGCCDGRAGSPWGFGWTAGFRYISFNEDWEFSGDTTDTAINGDLTELNYRVRLDNNLFGFQLGSGLSYCVTSKLTAYAIAKLGVYANFIEQSQRIYGPAGPGTLNNGPFAGQDFAVDANDTDLALAGQFDLGGRWAVTSNWSVNFGYRVLGLTGVAISEDNVAQGNLQNLLGIADTQTQGAFLMHGGYIGATYCW
jgi:opacity protein-like surface antigen